LATALSSLQINLLQLQVILDVKTCREVPFVPSAGYFRAFYSRHRSIRKWNLSISVGMDTAPERRKGARASDPNPIIRLVIASHFRKDQFGRMVADDPAAAFAEPSTAGVFEAGATENDPLLPDSIHGQLDAGSLIASVNQLMIRLQIKHGARPVSKELNE
jgi:hypothetical protein